MSLRQVGIRVGPWFGCAIVAFLAWVALSGAMMSLPEHPAVLSGPQTHPAAAPVSHDRMVFLLNTGLEDLQKMNTSVRNAIAAKRSGYLKDVVWLACGRGVEALADIGARPKETRELLHAAKSAGVRVLVCAGALEQMGLTAGKLDPLPDATVPNGIVTLAELYAEGYQPVQY